MPHSPPTGRPLEGDDSGSMPVCELVASTHRLQETPAVATSKPPGTGADLREGEIKVVAGCHQNHGAPIGAPYSALWRWRAASASCSLKLAISRVKKSRSPTTPALSCTLKPGRTAFRQVLDLLAQNSSTQGDTQGQHSHPRPNRPSLYTKGSAARGYNTTSTTSHTTIPHRIRTTLSAKVSSVVALGLEH